MRLDSCDPFGGPLCGPLFIGVRIHYHTRGPRIVPYVTNGDGDSAPLARHAWRVTGRTLDILTIINMPWSAEVDAEAEVS